MQYERNDMNLVEESSGKGDTLEIHPAYEEFVVRIELFGDDVERITKIDPVTGERLAELEEVTVFPASHYVTDGDDPQSDH